MATVDVLLVDDNVPFIEMLRLCLEQNGYKVALATNGKMAIEFLNRAGCRLIFTDLFMPEADGLEVLLATRQTSLPVITMSGTMSFDPQLFQRVALHFGARRTMLKPFSLDDFLGAVREEIGDPR